MFVHIFFRNTIPFIYFRLTRAYITPRIDHRISETEAGRRFLEKLRENHDDDVLVGGGDEKRPKESVSVGTAIGDGSSGGGRFSGGHSGGISSLHIPLLELKRKQSALRASLEELIVEYLRGLTAEGENDLSTEYFEHNRERRKKRDHRTKNGNNVNAGRQSRSNSISSTASTVGNDIEIDVLSESDEKRKRIQFSDGSITEFDENAAVADAAAALHAQAIKKELLQQPVCGAKKRRIIHLDRNVLDSAVGNESDYEHNIRRLLNYR